MYLTLLKFLMFSLKGKITDLDLATENDVGGMVMVIITAIIHDESGLAPFRVFGGISHVVKDEKCYNICNLSLSKYKSDQLLKTTEIKTLKGIDHLYFNVEGREIGQNII